MPNAALAPGSVLRLRELSYVVWGLLLVGFVLPLSIVVISSHRPPDADFTGFYSLGRILNEYSPRELYNYDLQKRICEEVHPQKGQYGPLPYPPFVALIFRPMSILPYWAAYFLWVVASVVLYGIGLNIAMERFFSRDHPGRPLIFALAYAYFPFLGYTAGNGQLAAVGFFAVTLALREEDNHRPLRSGLALCLCLYKPTILLLILPMLVVTRRLKTLAGFLLGALSIILITTMFEGFAVWADFLRAIRSFGSASVGVKTASILPLAKYVDLSAFSSNLPGGRSNLGVASFFIFCGLAITVLFRFWRRARTSSRSYQVLLWATTLTWTLLINVYVPIYDSILVVLSALITAGALRTWPNVSLRRWFTANWILIVLCSWFSVPLSRATGIQCMTLLFAFLGILQFAMLRRLAHSSDGDLAGASV